MKRIVKQQKTTQLYPHILHAMRKYAAENNVSHNDVIAQALIRHLNIKKDEKGKILSNPENPNI